MTTPNSSITPIPAHPWATQQALIRLRERYRQDRDLFTRQEVARLAFVRWLCQTGRLQPSAVRGPGVPPEGGSDEHRDT